MKGPRSFSLAIALALAIPAVPAAAQLAGNGYLFHAPHATIGIRGGYSAATAGSDVFDDVTRQLTLNKSDFGSLTVGADIAFSITSKLDLTLDAGYSRSNHKSEFRDFVDNNDQPIEQTTSFERIPITANLKLHLAPTGRSIGQLAWIPSRFVPYVGGGVGVMKYRFKQQGDFVDFNTNAVFPATLDSGDDGGDWAFVRAGDGRCGVQLLADVRHDARCTLSARPRQPRDGIQGYDKIDLSGVTASVGLSVRL